MNEISSTNKSNNDTLTLIRTTYSTLNNSEKKVAEFILENPTIIANLSISDLADQVGTSNTTIFRFVNKLGFKGYPDFKIHFAQNQKTQLDDIYEEISVGEDSYIIMQKLIAGYEYSFRETLSRNKGEVLDQVVISMKKAPCIYLFGMGGSYSLANDAMHKWIRNGLKMIITSDPHWQSMYVSTANKDDLVMIFSSSGKNQELLNIQRQAKARGLSTISFTTDHESPLAKETSLTLLTYGREYALRSEALEARLSTLLLIDTLYLMLANKDQKSQETTLSTLHAIRSGISSHRNCDDEGLKVD